MNIKYNECQCDLSNDQKAVLQAALWQDINKVTETDITIPAYINIFELTGAYPSVPPKAGQWTSRTNTVINFSGGLDSFLVSKLFPELPKIQTVMTNMEWSDNNPELKYEVDHRVKTNARSLEGVKRWQNGLYNLGAVVLADQLSIKTAYNGKILEQGSILKYLDTGIKPKGPSETVYGVKIESPLLGLTKPGVINLLLKNNIDIDLALECSNYPNKKNDGFNQVIIDTINHHKNTDYNTNYNLDYLFNNIFKNWLDTKGSQSKWALKYDQRAFKYMSNPDLVKERLDKLGAEYYTEYDYFERSQDYYKADTNMKLLSFLVAKT